MTWFIKVIYQPDDRSKQAVGFQQVLTDEMVIDANFDVRVEAFKSMVSKLDKELKNENT